jgi:catechol 2,3-dioxygenase-like lactoylglutathione lyase family enzyme
MMDGGTIPMTHPVLGIDHTYLLVRDLEASADLYRRLGFTLSPRGLHSAQKGTANHTIIFRDDYLELLGVVSDTDWNAQQRRTLATVGEGLQAIANRTRDADAARGALDALGIGTEDVSAFSRPLPLPGGGEGIASFRTLGFAESEVPFGHFFLCQHETPDMVWRPELQVHANDATGLGGIIAISDDPLATAETYARFYAEGLVSQAEGGFRVETGNNSAPLFFFDPRSIPVIYPGLAFRTPTAGGFFALQIRVTDLEITRRSLLENGVSFVATPRGGIAVSQADASGVVVEFLEG